MRRLVLISRRFTSPLVMQRKMTTLPSKLWDDSRPVKMWDDSLAKLVDVCIHYCNKIMSILLSLLLPYYAYQLSKYIKEDPNELGGEPYVMSKWPLAVSLPFSLLTS